MNPEDFINGALAVVVETPHGRVRRRLYLSLKAAENAARRARDAGHSATVLLVELNTVGEVAPAFKLEVA
ncbi:hypothetical protein [Gulosibacter bifidus]|uniref:Uncharacterized protein n=1 Tax=Gulosibacter bifidus TaxID=272239 RepID=A0ABW5RIC0_9MICO|nr:hypothetical protein [Gulosibacter bifidus]